MVLPDIQDDGTTAARSESTWFFSLYTRVTNRGTTDIPSVFDVNLNLMYCQTVED